MWKGPVQFNPIFNIPSTVNPQSLPPDVLIPHKSELTETLTVF